VEAAVTKSEAAGSPPTRLQRRHQGSWSCSRAPRGALFNCGNWRIFRLRLTEEPDDVVAVLDIEVGTSFKLAAPPFEICGDSCGYGASPLSAVLAHQGG